MAQPVDPSLAGKALLSAADLDAMSGQGRGLPPPSQEITVPVRARLGGAAPMEM